MLSVLIAYTFQIFITIDRLFGEYIYVYHGTVHVTLLYPRYFCITALFTLKNTILSEDIEQFFQDERFP